MEEPDPKVVGSNFIVRYYTVLNKNPENLSNFYGEKAVCTFGDEDEEGKIVHGQEEISKLLASHNYQDCSVSLFVLDCQRSLNGGIFITVVGEMTNRGETRKFLQNFFLERVDTSFYVLNDVFRYLRTPIIEDDYDQGDIPQEESDHLVQEEEPLSPPLTSEPQTQPPTTQNQNQSPVVAAKAEPVVAATPAPSVPQQQQQHQPQKESEKHEKPAAEKAAEKKETAPHKNEGSPAHPREPVSKTWASIARRGDGEPSSSATTTSTSPATSQPSSAPHPQPSQPAQQQQPQHQPAHQPQHQPPVRLPDRHYRERERERDHRDRDQHREPVQLPHRRPPPPLSPVLVEGCSIYASDFPYAEVGHAQLMTLFMQYGKVRNIVLKPQKGFAFIEYESPQAVQAALDGMRINPPILDGRHLLIEERKPRGPGVLLPRGGRGRGRGPPRGMLGGRYTIGGDKPKRDFGDRRPYESRRGGGERERNGINRQPPQQQPQTTSQPVKQ